MAFEGERCSGMTIQNGCCWGGGGDKMAFEGEKWSGMTIKNGCLRERWSGISKNTEKIFSQPGGHLGLI